MTPAEMSMAAQVGCRRQIESLMKGLKPAYGASAENAWSIHVEGACGELATAKALGIYWDGSVNSFARADLETKRLQVRTRSKENYDLIVRDKDSNDEAFVLVIGIAPDFEVVGYCLGSEAKQDQYKKTYGGRDAAYFVPRDKMHPIELLLK